MSATTRKPEAPAEPRSDHLGGLGLGGGADVEQSNIDCATSTPSRRGTPSSLLEGSLSPVTPLTSDEEDEVQDEILELKVRVQNLELDRILRTLVSLQLQTAALRQQILSLSVSPR